MIYNDLIEEWHSPRWKKFWKDWQYVIVPIVVGLVLYGGGFLLGAIMTKSSSPVGSQPGVIVCTSPMDNAEDAMAAAKTYANAARNNQNLSNVLTEGDRGPTVKKYQKQLNEVLDINLKVDGIFGSDTEKAAEEYREIQRQHTTNSEMFIKVLSDLEEDYYSDKEKCLENAGR